MICTRSHTPTGITPGVVAALDDPPADKEYFNVIARNRSESGDEAISPTEGGDRFANARDDSFVLTIPGHPFHPGRGDCS